MKTADEYLESLRQRKVRLFIRGQQVADPVAHPLVSPSVRAVAETYRLAADPAHRDLLVARSRFVDGEVNRFTHIFGARDDLLRKTEMQRLLGRTTGTCFQRCVGLDALNALFAVTFQIDAAAATPYHGRLLDFLRHVQREDLVVCGAMTDPKGDRRRPPAEQPDAFLRVVGRRDRSIVVRGAKLHQTGVANSHEILVMPGRTLGPDEQEFAVSCAIPVDAPGVTLVYGRQPNDDRRLGAALDQGNARYGGQEAIVLFDDVEVPLERVFLLGETAHAAALVDAFANHHRHSYGGCKSGNGDVLIGAAALAARLIGVERASHVRDKLVEMVHLNETIYACGVACATRADVTPSGALAVDPLLANVCKQNVTRFPYEISRLAEDLAGGLLVTLPGAEDLAHPELGPRLGSILRGAEGTGAERAAVLRLIECMTLGGNAVAYRTESMHGAGSPQAQRVRLATLARFEEKVAAAARLAGLS